jgi:hypothetical protein
MSDVHHSAEDGDLDDHEDGDSSSAAALVV